MIRKSFIAVIVLTGAMSAHAQGKIGYVDFQYILSQVQAASDVQSELQRLASEWTQEIEVMQDSVTVLEKDLETISIALSKSSRDALLKDIQDRKQAVAVLREKRFSPVAGDLYKKQQELLQPVIDKIKKAIDKVRIRSKYDVLFDISAGNPVSIDKRLDLTVDVIDELPAVGLTAKKQSETKMQNEEQGRSFDSGKKSGRDGKKSDGSKNNDQSNKEKIDQ